MHFPAGCIGVPCLRLSSAKEDPELTKVAEGIYARIVSPDGEAVANVGRCRLRSVGAGFRHALHSGRRGIAALGDPVRHTKAGALCREQPLACRSHAREPGVCIGAQLISSSNARRDMLQLDLPSLNRTVRMHETQLEKLRQAVSQRARCRGAAEACANRSRAREDYLQTMSRLKITASGCHGGRKRRDQGRQTGSAHSVPGRRTYGRRYCSVSSRRRKSCSQGICFSTTRSPMCRMPASWNGCKLSADS